MADSGPFLLARDEAAEETKSARLEGLDPGILLPAVLSRVKNTRGTHANTQESRCTAIWVYLEKHDISSSCLSM